MNDDTPITHDSTAARFSLVVDGRECELDYRLTDNVMTITHTGVPRALEGRGLAARLTKVALDHARASGWTVRPVCSYARVYMQRHPETQDLLAD